MELVAKSSGFGQRLKELREAAELSQYELAKRSGVSGASLSRIEKGERDPSWDTVVKLARALGVSIAEFDPDRDEDTDDTTSKSDRTQVNPPTPKARRKKK